MGTEERLFRLVAHLVMDPEVLRQNNNYPFRTSAQYVWFVALEDEQVLGFIPVEMKESVRVINNYHVPEGQVSVLDALLKEVLDYFAGKCVLQAVVHTRHLSVFEENGFVVIRTWKLYIKMEHGKRR